ncbi:MAG: hypothetical protein ACRC92_20315 [Peptostreptococcaceae bacterium]
MVRKTLNKKETEPSRVNYFLLKDGNIYYGDVTTTVLNIKSKKDFSLDDIISVKSNMRINELKLSLMRSNEFIDRLTYVSENLVESENKVVDENPIEVPDDLDVLYLLTKKANDIIKFNKTNEYTLILSVVGEGESRKIYLSPYYDSANKRLTIVDRLLNMMLTKN